MIDVTDLQQEYVSAKRGAELVNLSRTRFYKLMGSAGFPASVKIGGARLFSRAELLHWKRERDKEKR